MLSEAGGATFPRGAIKDGDGIGPLFRGGRLVLQRQPRREQLGLIPGQVLANPSSVAKTPATARRSTRPDHP